MRITAKTKLYGVIGYPVSRSLSPMMHNAVFLKRGIDAVYLAFDVRDLEYALRGSLALGIKGLNVTIPHKEAILKFCDELSDEVKLVGAGNTLVFGDVMKVFNTDVEGFRRALGNFHPSRVAVLGAGGAARACIVALKDVNLKIFNRSPDRAKKLAEEMSEKLKREVEAGKLYKADLEEFDLVVNCTPFGLNGEDIVDEMGIKLPNKGMVFDLIYSETPLLKRAKKLGLEVKDGTEMLVYQGAESLRIWGIEPDIDVMFDAICRNRSKVGK